MGIQFHDDRRCVGVVVPLQEKELAPLDEREIGYDRVLLDLAQIRQVPFLEQSLYQNSAEADLLWGSDKAHIWTYAPLKSLSPSSEYPIAQSYLDTMLRGCLAINEEFAKEFLRTTRGWSKADLLEDQSEDPTVHWLNDRTKPIYPRGDVKWSLQQACYVDSLLEECRPDEFALRASLAKVDDDPEKRS